MKSIYDVLKGPVQTEKMTDEAELKNIVAFKVDANATKREIKSAVEKLFKVRVITVNTQIYRGKMKRVGRTYGKRDNWKKALVKLHPEDKIDFLEIT